MAKAESLLDFTSGKSYIVSAGPTSYPPVKHPALIPVASKLAAKESGLSYFPHANTNGKQKYRKYFLVCER